MSISITNNIVTCRWYTSGPKLVYHYGDRKIRSTTAYEQARRDRTSYLLAGQTPPASWLTLESGERVSGLGNDSPETTMEAYLAPDAVYVEIDA